jgi:hypothetical protein
MRGVPQQQSAQNRYLDNLPEVPAEHRSRAQMHQNNIGYHQQSDELSMSDSRQHPPNVTGKPQYQQQTFAHTAGFGGIGQLENIGDGRAAPGSMGNLPSDLNFTSKFARGIHKPQSMHNNENQNQMNQDYLRQMERLEAGIGHFKKDYDIAMKERNGGLPPEKAKTHYDNAQDFLGEANLSAINPIPSDMNLRQSQ